MQHIKLFLSFFVLLLTIAGCEKDIVIVNETEVPEGYVKMPIDMSSLNFGSQLITRTGETSIATDREKKVNEHSGIFIFDNETQILIQFAYIIKDVNADDKNIFYAFLKKVEKPVLIAGLSNVDETTILEGVNGVNIFSYNDFESLINSKISVYDKANNTLKNNDSSLLPTYFEGFALNEITPASIKEYETTYGTTKTTFAYARVDVQLNTPPSSSDELISVYAINAPKLPGSMDRVETAVVTPTTNLPPYPNGIIEENKSTRYIQGLYMYPTVSLPNGSETSTTPTYLILQAKRAGAFGPTFYKIEMRYNEPNGDGSTSIKYDIKNNVRYLVKINKLNSPGYPSIDAAKIAPPSNIEYEIIVDETSTEVVSNGQYYIGATEGDVWSEVITYDTHMLFFDPFANGLTSYNEGSNWVLNQDLTYSVDIEFTYNIGTGVNVGIDDLAKTLDMPKNVIIMVGNGYETLDSWDDSFGTKKFRLTLPADFTTGDVVIKIGELTKIISLNVKKAIITDYTNETFVNELTGLDSNYGLNTGLRVANSYILPPRDDLSTVFYIPVNKRINEFWGNTYARSTAGRIDEPDWTVANSQFDVDISWYDGANIEGLVVEKAFSPEKNGATPQNAIKVTLPPNFKHQNVTVNVTKAGVIVWSWHLWITDYNPYITATPRGDNPEKAANPLSVNVNTSVAVGTTTPSTNAVHRYNSGANIVTTTDIKPPHIVANVKVDAWTTIYKNKFIMDRNLGAIAATYEGHGSPQSTSAGTGWLCYQFGRKDPFPGSNATNYSDGETFSMSMLRVGHTFAQAVKVPESMINKNGFWEADTESVVLSVHYIWNDQKINAPDYTVGKSIFDPSPLGYRVPVNGTWAAFPIGEQTDINNGFNYTLTNNDNAYYPFAGCRYFYYGNLSNLKTNTTLWSASIALLSDSNLSTSRAYMCSINAAIGAAASTLQPRAYGFSVRSIQE